MTRYTLQEDKVAPLEGGRICTDTRTWRDASELELDQQAELEHMDYRVMILKNRCEELEDALDELRKERDRLLTLAVKWCDRNHHDCNEISKMFGNIL